MLSFLLLVTSVSAQASLVENVDPFVGTAPSSFMYPLPMAAGGDTQPDAGVPFGMIQWGPDTDHPETSGYNYDDKNIRSFSLTHMSGAGCPNTADLPMVPFVGTAVQRLIPFSHSQEQASPGYYSVDLSPVKVELTSTERTGLGRFHFKISPPQTAYGLILDTTRGGAGSTSGHLTIKDSKHVSGFVSGGNFCGSGNQYQLYFAIEFERPSTHFSSSGGIGTFRFDDGSQTTNPVQMKVGISYVSENGAEMNLKAESPDWDFDRMHAVSTEKWNAALGKIQVQSQDSSLKKVFYTALYHSLLHPNLSNDVDGSYLGFDQKVHPSAGHEHYANFSGWDIYRSQIQLISALFPKRASDIAQTLVETAQQCGAFPVWSENNSDTGVMVGDPGSIIVADIFSFGAVSFDAKTALQVMKKNAFDPAAACGGKAPIRPDLSQYLAHGYVANASTTLEYATADFAISQFALALGDSGFSKQLAARSALWRNLFDPTTGYIRPRSTSGAWETPFDLTSSTNFVEGDSAQYTLAIPFDFGSLVAKIGKPGSVETRLDAFFSQLNAGQNSSHLYIGNEPSFWAPWVYLWAGLPSHTQEVVHRLVTTSFADLPNGLPGNDDLGATSSWFVWSALGIFPGIPGVGGVVVGSPVFPQVDLNLENGKTLTIRAGGSGFYVKDLSLNGTAVNRTWIPWSNLQAGGVLDFGLATEPSNWGSAPPSFPPDSGLNAGGTSSDSVPGNSGLDGTGHSYSRNLLSKQKIEPNMIVTVGEIKYTWPALDSSGLDHFLSVGQTLPFDAPLGTTRLGFLGASTEGPSSGEGSLIYSDETEESFTLRFSDWTLNAGASSVIPDNQIAAAMDYRNSSNGAVEKVQTYLFTTSIALDPLKHLIAVRLPSQTNRGLLHLFSLGLPIQK